MIDVDPTVAVAALVPDVGTRLALAVIKEGLPFRQIGLYAGAGRAW